MTKGMWGEDINPRRGGVIEWRNRTDAGIKRQTDIEPAGLGAAYNHSSTVIKSKTARPAEMWCGRTSS